MAKILTDKEIAEIFKKVTTEAHWIDDQSQYIEFLKETAEVCADHFGGEVADVSYRGNSVLGYALTFVGDESVPEGGGAYAEYDKDAPWSGCSGDEEDCKILTDKEIGALMSKAVVDSGYFSCQDTYIDFLKKLGNIIADHFGGICGKVDYDVRDTVGYKIAFHPNECLPADGGIYKDYDADVVWTDGIESKKAVPLQRGDVTIELLSKLIGREVDEVSVEGDMVYYYTKNGGIARESISMDKLQERVLADSAKDDASEIFTIQAIENESDRVTLKI
jgi:hypothetical protein